MRLVCHNQEFSCNLVFWYTFLYLTTACFVKFAYKCNLPSYQTFISKLSSSDSTTGHCLPTCEPCGFLNFMMNGTGVIAIERLDIV